MHEREHLRIGRGIAMGMIGGVIGWILMIVGFTLALGMWR